MLLSPTSDKKILITRHEVINFINKQFIHWKPCLFKLLTKVSDLKFIIKKIKNGQSFQLSSLKKTIRKGLEIY